MGETSNPRGVFRETDRLDRLVRQASRAAELLDPKVGLGLLIGSYHVDEPAIQHVVINALNFAADSWKAEANRLEATVVVAPMTAPALTPLEAAAEAWACRPYRSLDFGEQQLACDIVRPLVQAALTAYDVAHLPGRPE